jgi:hypothetical protein
VNEVLEKPEEMSGETEATGEKRELVLTPRSRKILGRLAEKPHLLGHIMGYKKLGEIHSDWIKYQWLNPAESVLQAPRGSYKSVADIIVGTHWWLLFHPDHRIIISRKTHTQSAEAIQEIRKQYESDNVRNLYWDLFKIDNLKGERWSDNIGIDLSTKTRITKEPSVMPIGLGGAVTGYHCERFKCDDIVTIADRYSKAERLRTMNFIKELVNIPDRDGGKTSYTGTPWHKEDAFSMLPKGKVYTVHTPRLRREIPDYTDENLAAIKRRLGISLYSANYELKHIADEDRLFGEPIFQDWKFGTSLIGYLDPAYSGENHTALTFAGRLPESKKIQVRGYVWDRHVNQCYKEIVTLCHRFRVGTLFVEINADQGQAYKDLFALRKGLCKPVREKMNKHARIVAFVLGNWEHLVFPHDVEGDWMNEVMDYQEGQEPDDAPDSLAGSIRALTAAAGSRAPKAGRVLLPKRG